MISFVLMRGEKFIHLKPDPEGYIGTSTEELAFATLFDSREEAHVELHNVRPSQVKHLRIVKVNYTLEEL